jgi:hypothetical protein
MTLDAARLVGEGQALHVTTGPATSYWKTDAIASGDFHSQSDIQRAKIHVADRDPRLPEGWKVPSRASPYGPGSLGSGMTG